LKRIYDDESMKARIAEPSSGPRASIVRETESRLEPGHLQKEDVNNAPDQRCSDGAVCARCRLDQEFCVRNSRQQMQGVGLRFESWIFSPGVGE
jgi:hypothetical protein